jgi:formylglycine-generating enzyme required for sulfatase activity
MSLTTVTWGQWEAVMGQGTILPHRRKNLPVETVSWENAQDFIRKLRALDGKRYRLPTEAEWEYACRAGTTTPYYSGNALSTKDANFGKFKKGHSPLATTPVGSYPPNPWSLYDMCGNVWQWCQDWYGDYPQEEVVDPQGPKEGRERVLRGGSFADVGPAPSARRHKYEPDGRAETVGFRICFSRD